MLRRADCRSPNYTAISRITRDSRPVSGWRATSLPLFVVSRWKEPERYLLTCNSRQIDKIVYTAVRLLASFEAISGRDVPITHIEPSGEIFVLTDVPNLFICGKNINTTRLIWVRNAELAEWPFPIFIKRNIVRIFILVLRHELLHCSVRIFQGLYLTDKLELVARDFQVAMTPIDNLRGQTN